MSWFANKPAFLVLLPFIAGLVLAYNIDVPLRVAFPFSLLCILAILVWRKFDISHWLLLVLFLLMGVIHLELHTRHTPPGLISHFADLPGLVSVEGVIIRPVEQRGSIFSTTLRIDSMWVLDSVWPASGACLLQMYEKCDELEYGHRIVARGQLRLPSGERNPGDFNYQKYLAAQDIHAIFRVSAAAHIVMLNRGEGHPIMARVVYPVREFVLRAVDASLDGQPAALLKALLVGVRGEVDTGVRDAFANAGVIHVLAVSGLHVGFVLVALIGLFSFLRIPNPWRILLVMVALVFYALLTGLKPSVVRATVMAIVYLGGQMLQRRAHLLNTLSIAALIILMLSPLDLFEPGFQLSFAALLGIIFIYRRLSALTSPLKVHLAERGQVFLLHVLNLFLVSVAAQLATLPLTIYYFNRFSLIALLTNLVVIPAVGIIVALGMVAVLVFLFSPFVSSVYFNVVWLLMQFVLFFVDAAQRLPFAYFVVPRPSVWFFLFYLMAVLLFINWRSMTWKKTLLFAVLILMNGYVWSHLGKTDHRLSIIFFDVGQGDSALIEFPNGRRMLVDAGDNTEYVDYGERVIYPYLVRNGIRKIDDVLVTHAHSDHNGGVLYLLNRQCVGRLIKTHLQADVQLDSLIEAAAVLHQVPIRYVKSGDTLSVDPGVLLMVLHPTPSFIQQANGNADELNNSSIVLKCVYHNQHILLAGDAEIPAEQKMLAYGDLLNSDILKCAHHGSQSSSDSLFRYKVNAEYAIVSVAKFNRFGLPSETLLQHFELEGTTVCRTSDRGAIRFLIYPDYIIKL